MVTVTEATGSGWQDLELLVDNIEVVTALPMGLTEIVMMDGRKYIVLEPTAEVWAKIGQDDD